MTCVLAGYASVLTLEALVQQGVAFGHAASLVKWMAQGTVLGKRAGERRVHPGPTRPQARRRRVRG